MDMEAFLLEGLQPCFQCDKLLLPALLFGGQAFKEGSAYFDPVRQLA